MKELMIQCLTALSLAVTAPVSAVDDGCDGGRSVAFDGTFVNACDVKGGEFVLWARLAVSGQTGGQIEFLYELVDGTAKAGQDFTPVVGGKGVIPAGAQVGYLPVEVQADAIVEAEEYFFLRVTFTSGAVVVDGEAMIVIEENQT